LKDYKDLSKTISVKAGKTTEVTEELVLMPGSLVINSNPVGATVILAGKEMGVTPLALEKIIPGSYDLIIKKVKYQENTTKPDFQMQKSLNYWKIIVYMCLGQMWVLNQFNGIIQNFVKLSIFFYHNHIREITNFIPTQQKLLWVSPK